LHINLEGDARGGPVQWDDSIEVPLPPIKGRRDGKPVNGDNALGLDRDRLLADQIDAGHQQAERGRAGVDRDADADTHPYGWSMNGVVEGSTETSLACLISSKGDMHT
jgi:hypothetical protein